MINFILVKHLMFIIFKIIHKGEQYLAIGGYKSTTDEHHTIGQRQKDDMNNSIQIWKIDCSLNISDAKSPHLDMVLCHNFGCAFDLQWCPYGAHDKFKVN